ncbi:B121.4 [miniopterid betaherpesvirus 1]|uniref:B121.4 n=1 Tax=miniopterid betaherpesvirus 1 TaxID=3070189 RepID=I3VQB5_9BETA|nr:B121.4 [miniopterid betaherpesvirus 1]AFK83959.1 B121.4 [miniopterid betaherpesvirus 1]
MIAILMYVYTSLASVIKQDIKKINGGHSLTCTYYGNPVESNWTRLYNRSLETIVVVNSTYTDAMVLGEYNVTYKVERQKSNSHVSVTTILKTTSPDLGSYWCAFGNDRELLTIPFDDVSMRYRSNGCGWIVNCTSHVRCGNTTVLWFMNSSYIGAADRYGQKLINGTIANPHNYVVTYLNGTGKLSLINSHGNLSCLYSSCDTYGAKTVKIPIHVTPRCRTSLYNTTRPIDEVSEDTLHTTLLIVGCIFFSISVAVIIACFHNKLTEIPPDEDYSIITEVYNF